MATLEKATLTPLMGNSSDPDDSKDVVTVQFNPTALHLQVSNSVDGGASQSRQAEAYIGQSSMSLTLELVFDSADEGETEAPVDVRDKVRPLEQFVKPSADGSKDNPSRVRFQWGPTIVDGVMTSLSMDFDLFSSGGVPLRAKVSTAISGQEPKFAALETGPGGAGDAERPPDSGGSGGDTGPGSAGAGGDKTAAALAGESAADFAARVGLDPAAWRGLSLGLDATLSLQAGVEIDFSAGLSASAGLGVKVGLEAGASVSLDASFGVSVGGGASASGGAAAGGGAKVSASASASAAAGAAAGFALSAAGGVGAAVAAVQIVKAEVAASSTRQAFAAPAPAPAVAGSRAAPASGGGAGGGGAGASSGSSTLGVGSLPAATSATVSGAAAGLVVSAPARPARPEQPRAPLARTGLPSASIQAATASAPRPPLPDPRAVSFGFGVPLRARVQGAAEERGGALGGYVPVSPRRAGEAATAPVANDLTSPPWRRLPATTPERAAADAAQAKRRPAKPCGCRGGCGHAKSHGGAA